MKEKRTKKKEMLDQFVLNNLIITKMNYLAQSSQAQSLHKLARPETVLWSYPDPF